MLLLVLCVGCVVIAYGALKNLWGYQDSSTGFYIGVASISLISAALSGACGIFLLRH